MALLVHKLLALAVALMIMGAAPAAGQPVGTAVSCTASLVTSFAPCLNFITNNSASPTADCCRSLGALVNASAGCACLILTGSVPLGVPVNRSLAVNMPRACNTSAVPLQCQDPTTAALSPAPGPVAQVAPTLAPLPPVTPTTPVAEVPAPEAPVVEPTATPPVSQGQTRPAVLPSSAWKTKNYPISATGAALVLLLALGGALV